MKCSYCRIKGHNKRTCLNTGGAWSIIKRFNIYIPSDKEIMLEELIKVLQRGINNSKMEINNHKPKGVQNEK
tara:strand:- start:139 stop:354 length:216 start_codon:yes stop_codon:yes gene_type:complete